MIYPIVAYGSQVLKEKCSDIRKDYNGLDILIKNMWETMYAANGVGIAAPQINKSLRIFLVDTSNISIDDNQNPNPIKKVFINAEVLSQGGDKWSFPEGCLSIPDIREDVFRFSEITIKYFDENFETHIDSFNDINARVILHEYDHVEGILFTDHISLLRKKMINRKLNNIMKGKVKVDYRMKFK